MSRRAQENLVAAVIIFIFLGVIWMSLGYGPRARMVPIPVAAFGLLLAIGQLLWQNLRPTEGLQVDLLEVLTKRKKQPDVTRGSDSAAAGPMAGAAGRGWRKEVAVYGMVLGFTGLVLLFGPIVAIFLFTTAYFLVSGHYPRWKALCCTVGFTVVVYLLFVVALEIQLYHGVLEPLVDRFR